MIPLSDGIPGRRFPVVNVLLIVANFSVFSPMSYRTETRRLVRRRSNHATSLTPAASAYLGASAGSRPCLCMATGSRPSPSVYSWR
jgi:hypothetical protein